MMDRTVREERDGKEVGVGKMESFRQRRWRNRSGRRRTLFVDEKGRCSRDDGAAFASRELGTGGYAKPPANLIFQKEVFILKDKSRQAKKSFEQRQTPQSRPRADFCDLQENGRLGMLHTFL